ncbi:odorant receptor 4-like [Bombus impatiens]|uniref:Odorant receptor n=1 Tax=Bombus impatiens TaxID=132113 RepID=A0A6P3DJH3_BOMIM|nr:odorant receptor 4-like [Bombus impatiens]
MLDLTSEPRISNVIYARDFEYSIQVNRWLMQPIGAWPRLAKTTRTQRLFVRSLNFICHSLIIFMIVPCILYIAYEAENSKTRMKAIGPVSHWLMGELNYCCLLSRIDDIVRCIKHVERDWQIVENESDRELMLKNAKVGRFIALVAALCMHSGVLAYTVTNGFKKMMFHLGNDSYSMYPLPYPFYTNLLDVRFSPANEIVLTLQLLSGFVVTSVTVGACGLAAVLTMHASGQLNVVMARLDNLVNTKEEEKQEEQKVAQRKLGIIVEHHLRTLSLMASIEKVMNMICLVELVGCTMNMCMIKYYLLTEKSKDVIIAYAILYASMVFNIFIFCYIGEIITEQGERVGKKVYMTEWYRLPPKTALGLVLVISRSSMVVKITAGKFVQISIATFGAVFKTSFAYLNMIRTMM